MPFQRRYLLSGLGAMLSGGLAGCFTQDIEDEAILQVYNNLEEQTLEIEISESGDEQLFSDSITLSKDEQTTRESVITGKKDDSFSVKVTNGDETVSTTWQLRCVEHDNRRDLLNVSISPQGEIRIDDWCRLL